MKDIFTIKKIEMINFLRTNNIQNENILKEMTRLDRHLFVHEFQNKLAYDNRSLDIEYSQTISEPYIVALMLESSKINKNSRVLEIGTGSGYQTMLLSRLCSAVNTIEIVPQLAKKALKIFRKFHINNIALKVGDGFIGWKEEAPFDIIIVTAACKYTPPNLLKQLKVGGCIIIPLKNPDHTQTLSRIIKICIRNKYTIEKILDVCFIPMTGLVDY